MDAQLAQWQEQIRSAAAARRPLRLRGSGSKDWYGGPLQGEILDTRAWRGILAHAPEELVLSARCGTPMREIEQTLQQAGQMLACEPPHFGPDATLGGVLCAGLCGPGRERYGALRDAVLGVALLDGRGDLLRFGGQVMKNVAGYDVARMLPGSMGVLGLVTQVSLRLQPLPRAQVSLLLDMPQAHALQALQRWQLAGLPLDASCYFDGQLRLRLSGLETVVAAAQREIGGAIVVNGAQFWRDVREQQLDFFLQARSLWRLAAPADAQIAALPGRQLLEWGGALRWLALDTPPDPAFGAHLRQQLAACGGHATLMRGATADCPAFTPLAPAMLALQRRVKRVFDPALIFNPGRLYAGLEQD
ncbi:glycolate oxidase subunit GlcE [Massilia sp. W12]|uniref:glycolate oxidase subunit GlcE n=1 Tax=Massilia sp. W12 TaxID=3126507 RepID=UPI0030D0E302